MPRRVAVTVAALALVLAGLLPIDTAGASATAGRTEPVAARACAADGTCLDVFGYLLNDGGKVHAKITAQGIDVRIARIQIDSMAIVTTRGTVVTRGNASAPGTAGPATSIATGPITIDGNCRLYGVDVRVSWRTKDGRLNRSGQIAGWLTPALAQCPARNFDESGIDPSYSPLGRGYGGTALSVSADHRTLFADAYLSRGSAPAGVRRIQIDNVLLIGAGQVVSDSAPLGAARSDMSGAANETVRVLTRPYTPTNNCAMYRVTVHYSAAFNDGSTRRYQVATPEAAFCVK